MESSKDAETSEGHFDEIRKLIEAKHVDLKLELKKGQALQDKIQDITTEMDELHTSVTSEIRPALADSTEQLQRATTELAETSQLLELVEQLLQLGRQLEASRQLQEAGQLAEAADSACQLRQQTHELTERTGDQVSLLSDLRDRALVQEESVLHSLLSRWRSALSWDDPPATLTLRPAQLADTAAGLRRLDRLRRQLQLLADELLERLAAPLLAGGRLERRQDGQTVCLSVLPGEGQEADPVPAVEAAFAELTELLVVLREAALPGPLMAEFGALAGPPLAERLVAGPLAAAVPASLQEREEFDRVIRSTETFSAALAEIGFWERADTLLAYVSDVDRLMVDRLCADRLAAARRLLTAPLHVTVAIGESPPPAGTGEEGEMPHSPYRLPRCRVSDSAVQLADLVESTVVEAAAGSELLSARLHYTARHMLELSCALLPAPHGRPPLKTLPQQAAVAHNNLHYLAHRVTGMPVRHRCPHGSFLDLVPELRQTASDIFLAALSHQRQQLIDILGEAGLESLDQDTDLLTPASTALRRCCHQLRHVCRCWRPVLPAAVLARAAGLLLGVVSSQLTERLLAQQDIAASAATQMATAAGQLVAEAPALFRPEEGEDVPDPDTPTISEAESRALLLRHTAGWARFTELLIVLEENMRGILDRWADGKGPLAQHFTAEEARHLVRALFQNNERRAATLASIK